MKKRSTFSWILEFAGRKRSFYLGSVILAILGVAASFVPYLILVSTHDPELIELCCDYVLCIKNGKAVKLEKSQFKHS